MAGGKEKASSEKGQKVKGERTQGRRKEGMWGMGKGDSGKGARERGRGVGIPRKENHRRAGKNEGERTVGMKWKGREQNG